MVYYTVDIWYIIQEIYGILDSRYMVYYAVDIWYIIQ